MHGSHGTIRTVPGIDTGGWFWFALMWDSHLGCQAGKMPALRKTVAFDSVFGYKRAFDVTIKKGQP
jgi:hypothetical protein